MLGTRWIYDAAGDPVWQAQMRALVAGEVQAQHQNDSNVLDPSVAVDMAPQAGTGPGAVTRRSRGVPRHSR